MTPSRHLTSFIVRVGAGPDGPAVLLDLRTGETRAFASLQACLQVLSQRAQHYLDDAADGRKGSDGAERWRR